MSKSLHICVYCGSSTCLDQAYLDLAARMGELLVKAGHTLVWGGGSVGMMGALAQAVRFHGGKSVGVIPQFLIDKEMASRHADELIVTQNMRQRKEAMENRSDAFVALPGGFGTLEEFFEIVTLNILAQHEKPVILVNFKGFYDPLLKFVDQLFREKFAGEKYRACFRVTPDADAAIAALANGRATDA